MGGYQVELTFPLGGLFETFVGTEDHHQLSDFILWYDLVPVLDISALDFDRKDHTSTNKL